MAPQVKFEIVILKLIFMADIHPDYPRFTVTHKTQSPSGSSLTLVRDWINMILSFAKEIVPPNSSVCYTEWNVTSGDASLFTLRGHRFDKILLVFGEEFIYFNYYQSMSFPKNIEGSVESSVNYCGCCLNNQYLQIMDWVKCYIMENTYSDL